MRFERPRNIADLQRQIRNLGEVNCAIRCAACDIPQYGKLLARFAPLSENIEKWSRPVFDVLGILQRRGIRRFEAYGS